MAIEIIKAKHLPLSSILMVISYTVCRSLFSSYSEQIEQLINQVSYLIAFLLISLPCIALQYIENKYLWCRFININDNLSFMGISLGFSLGILSLGLW